MEAREEQIIKKTSENELSALISSTKIHNPGLMALLSIKKNTASIENDYTVLLQIENELDELFKLGLQIIEANTTPDATAQWKKVIQKTNEAVNGINETLTAAKDKIAEKDSDGYPELRSRLALFITAFKDNAKNAVDSGLTLLPQAIHPQWETKFAKTETTLVESILSHIMSYWVFQQVIERYTPDELNTITQIIATNIPADFTYEEAMVYQNDYYKALVNFKKEFKAEKNLWDKFLDILAGGTHQSPTEGAMMERWLDGEETNQ